MIDKYHLTKTTHTEQDIFDNRLFNVFVFSLPRCGSSMMTGVIERLGVRMVYTSEDDKEKREKSYAKRLGKYMPNEFFGEITNNQWTNQLQILTTPYSGCKMIIPVRNFHMDLVVGCPGKVVMMWREPEEIRQSHIAFYNKSPDVSYFESALTWQEMELNKNNIDYRIVKFQEVIDDPINTIQDIARFINAPNDIEEAVKFVNPDAKRFNKQELEIGI